MNPETQSSLSQLECNNSNHLVESTTQQPKKKKYKVPFEVQAEHLNIKS
ncbi:hypothetical protein SOVF_179700 [Spinacia oleracea]|nr:hypothetical protein SOVF_179700 [Spinacia oleracea]